MSYKYFYHFYKFFYLILNALRWNKRDVIVLSNFNNGNFFIFMHIIQNMWADPSHKTDWASYYLSTCKDNSYVISSLIGT